MYQNRSVRSETMIIKDIMKGGVAECTEDTALADVYDLIQDCDHGYVVILDSTTHRVPIGVVDEHSICQHIVAPGRNPKGLSAGSVMSSRIRRVSENTDVTTCRGLVETAGSEPILVTDEKRQFTGIVERSKLAAAIYTASKELGNPTAEFANLIPTSTPARVEFPGIRMA